MAPHPAGSEPAPVKGAGPRKKLTELYGQRDPLYRDTAHIIVESGKRSARHLAQLLAQQLACSDFKCPHG